MVIYCPPQDSLHLLLQTAQLTSFPLSCRMSAYLQADSEFVASSGAAGCPSLTYKAASPGGKGGRAAQLLFHGLSGRGASCRIEKRSSKEEAKRPEKVSPRLGPG